MKTQKRHLIILLALLVDMFALPLGITAQEKAGLPEWNGTSGTGSYTISSDKTVTSPITVTAGSTGGLTLTVSGSGSPKIIANIADGKVLFTITEGATLTIKGSAGQVITIDGGATYTHYNYYMSDGVTYNPDFDTYGPIVLSPASQTKRRAIAIGSGGGGLVLDYVVIQNFYSNSATISTGNDVSGKQLKLTNSEIKYCLTSGGGAGVNFGNGLYDNALWENFKIMYCKSTCADDVWGGIIRTGGTTKTILTMKNCEIAYNWNNSLGGGITWYSGGRAEAKLTLDENSSGEKTKVHHNVTTNDGGGMFGAGNIDMKSAEFYNNRALGVTNASYNDWPQVGMGGGIYLYLYESGSGSYVGIGINFNMTNKVSVHDNYAANKGGGICVELFATDYVGFNAMETPLSDPDDPESFTICKVRIQDGGQIYNNTAEQGGGLCVLDYLPARHRSFRKPTVNSQPNVTKTLKRIVTVEGGEITNNHVRSNSYTGSTSPGADPVFHPYSNSAYYGGGIYIEKCPRDKMSETLNFPADYTNYGAGTLTVNVTGGSITENTALQSSLGSGGGLCVRDVFRINGTNNYTTSFCNVAVGGASVPEISDNECDKDGGGVFIDRGFVNVTGCTIGDNTAGSLGGGLYVNPGSGIITLINSASSATTINGNEAAKGAGVYVASGSLTIRNEHASNVTTLKGNEATANGGAIYMNGGTCTIEGGASAGTGTKPSIGYEGAPNKAVLGAGLYSDGGTTTINNGDIQYNEASDAGGGIYANGGTVDVQYSATSKGSIHHNYAARYGGGLYISSSGRLNLYGKTVVEKNHVPTSGLGGGVYLEGTVQAGHSSSDEIKVATNYASDSEPATYNPVPSSIRNNIYLPNPSSPTTAPSSWPDTWPGVITVVNNGLDLGDNKTSIGFSVPHNFIPVIYCKTQSYLSGGTPNLMASNAIFEDGNRYTKYWASNPPTYQPTFIYLSADTWVQTVTTPAQAGAGYSVSGDGKTVTISTPEGLAWLISTVNGLNSQTADNFSGKTVNLTADLDMKAHSWVPIGMNSSPTPKAFKGTFNGNGHTISNIYCTYLGADAAGTGPGLGFFGILDGATVHDLFLKGVDLQVQNQSEGSFVLGAVANEAKSSTSIYNVTADSKMVSTFASTTMGGLVGTLTSGDIHSSAAMPDMKGYTMGGLVGTMASGTTLKNSFANVKFTYEGTSQYVGGLVATNSGGTVENCYVREQTGSSHGSHFGWVVGNNSSGTITYCYIPDGETAYTNSGSAANTCTTFGVTVTPYGYKHEDNQMAENAYNTHIVNGAFSRTGLKGLVATLNDWVGSSPTYSKWTRTCASPINDDYPVFAYTGYDCVASRSNIDLEYGKSFNDKFDEFVTANSGAGIGTIYLYKTPAALTPSGTDTQANVNKSNSGKATALYIHENVALKPASGSKAGDIVATVGITIDNSAGSNGANPTWGGGPDVIDWHFFSSALTNAPIGLEYGDNNPYAYGTYPTEWQTAFTNANGYFPTNLNTTTHVDGDYYADWDLYAYYEPDYHWINLKRNSHSHWHEDANYLGEHAWINYNNDTRFEPGHGYMVALAKEGYLQSTGTLNTHTSSSQLEVPLSYTSGISWTTREGHNLLGNPYLSYLDFDAFASNNLSLWKNSNISNAYYIIMDEDDKDYVRYVYGSSDNPFGAGRYLHAHQGFMVIVGGTGLTAKFDDGMRVTTASNGFRSGDRPNYALVNLFATDVKGNRDMVTVELGRPDRGGAPKQQGLRTSTGSLWCHYEDDDYALVFTQPGLDAANIRFATDEDAEYTMTWSTHNGEFSYLHLIDNMTGADIDCLTTEEYRFSSKTSDYESRFRLVFGYTGIEEPEGDGPSTGSGTFAYQSGDELVVNGEGRLEIIDMLGRIVRTAQLKGSQSMVPMPRGAAGVYVLRLNGENGTRTQKIVIR